MKKKSLLTSQERFIFNLLLITEQILGKSIFKYFLPIKQRLTSSLFKRLSLLPLPIAKQVERRIDLSPEEFKKCFFDMTEPVVFEKAARSWDCCQNWDLDYFKFGYGKENVLLVNAEGLTSREKNSDYEFLSVADLIENIKKGGDKYLRFSPLLENNPDLVRDLDMSWLQKMRGKKTFANTYYMFLGGKGKKTLLHTDQPCNIYVQVYGSKKWTLYSSQDTALLYPEISNSAYVKSPIDVDGPDHARYPLFKYARAYEVYLEAGDVLYVPPHTWHFVENLSDSIAVGYRFSSVSAAIKSSFTLSLLRILSTNPPVWKTMEYGKIDTNLIWAHSGGKIRDILKNYKIKK